MSKYIYPYTILLFLFSMCLVLSPADVAALTGATINLGSYTDHVGSNVTVPVEIINATEIAGGFANISFNPSIVNVEEVLPGDFGAPASNINNTAGFVSIAKSTATAVGKDPAELASIRFKGISKGLTTLNFTSAYLNYENGSDFIPETSDGEITVFGLTPDLIVTDINAYHYNTDCSPWFNLPNEIDVTVKNDGTTPAGASKVSLYIEGVLFGKLSVSSLSAGASETVTFENWKPVGEDCLQPVCDFSWSYHDYNLKGVADCDGEVAESNETNNETTVVEKACYNGYMADEPLENVAQGKLHGHLLFTTGSGVYTGLYSVGNTQTTDYEINVPAGASVELANLNVYYTWHYEKDSCPQMEVSITNATGTHILPLEKAYNDIKCWCPGASWEFPWGNYVYDLTDYIPGSGTYTYTVTVKRTGGPSFCLAAPGIVLVYEDENAPVIEYWVNKGADVLIGGRRADGGYLAWWECINNATFTASSETREVVHATLGVAAPWAGSSWTPGTTNYLYFNDIKLGTGVYHDTAYEETIDSITMHIGSTNAQVGVNVTSVTAHYLKGSENVVGQADDGDCMMPSNAFLVVEYGEEPTPTPTPGPGPTGVPEFNAMGLIALIGVLSVVLAVTTVGRKRKRVKPQISQIDTEGKKLTPKREVI